MCIEEILCAEQILAPGESTRLTSTGMSCDDGAPPTEISARDVLRDMWASRRSEAAHDLTSLLTTLESLSRSPDDSELRSAARRWAHQLVGAFGVFGFSDLKNAMARIDVQLSDHSVAIESISRAAREIRQELP